MNMVVPGMYDISPFFGPSESLNGLGPSGMWATHSEDITSFYCSICEARNVTERPRFEWNSPRRINGRRKSAQITRSPRDHRNRTAGRGHPLALSHRPTHLSWGRGVNNCVSLMVNHFYLRLSLERHLNPLSMPRRHLSSGSPPVEGRWSIKYYWDQGRSARRRELSMIVICNFVFSLLIWHFNGIIMKIVLIFLCRTHHPVVVEEIQYQTLELLNRCLYCTLCW